MEYCLLLGAYGYVEAESNLIDAWYWSSGQPMLVSHGYWSPGQPDPSLGQCIKMERSQIWSPVSSWSVDSCYHDLPFVCMKEPMFYNGRYISMKLSVVDGPFSKNINAQLKLPIPVFGE